MEGEYNVSLVLDMVEDEVQEVFEVFAEFLVILVLMLQLEMVVSILLGNTKE